MGKVKAHRVLKDIDIKVLISIEKYDKTNHITLSEDVKETISRKEIGLHLGKFGKEMIHFLGFYI